MTLYDLMLFFAWFFVLVGLRNCCVYLIMKYLFDKSQCKDISFYEFCNTKEIRRRKFKSNRGVFKSTILKGIMLVFLGLLIFIITFLLMRSEYSELFKYKL